MFRNQKNKEEYEEYGYTIVDLFSPELVEEMLSFYEKTTGQQPQKGFHSTLHNQSAEYRAEVFNTISGFASTSINKYLSDYKTITCSFVVKESGENSAVQIHQDWNLSDEPEHFALNIWTPLTEINDKNGPLHIIPGSHKLKFTYRGTGIPDPCNNIKKINLNKFYKVPLRPGQAIIYDVRLIHASPVNTTSKKRVSCAIGITSKSAAIIHYMYDNPGKSLYKFEVNPEFFLNYDPKPEFFSNLNLIHKKNVDIEYFRNITQNEIEKLLKRDTLFPRLLSFLKS